MDAQPANWRCYHVFLPRFRDKAVLGSSLVVYSGYHSLSLHLFVTFPSRGFKTLCGHCMKQRIKVSKQQDYIDTMTFSEVPLPTGIQVWNRWQEQNDLFANGSRSAFPDRSFKTAELDWANFFPHENEVCSIAHGYFICTSGSCTLTYLWCTLYRGTIMSI